MSALSGLMPQAVIRMPGEDFDQYRYRLDLAASTYFRRGVIGMVGSICLAFAYILGRLVFSV